MFSAAGATALSHVFPVDADTFEAGSSEAAISRLYGGIHYRYDFEAGKTAGIQAGQYAINHMIRDSGE